MDSVKFASGLGASRRGLWLLNPGFDLSLVLGGLLLALGSAALVLHNPSLFEPVLFLDLWLLGYHHVISTYTRLCFDTQSLRKYQLLLTGLLPLVLVATVGLYYALGGWAVVTLYVYWQWFHYARQSWGIAEAYRRQMGAPVRDGGGADHMWLKVSFYLVPVWGLLSRCHQNPDSFLSMPVRLVEVPVWMVNLAGVAAVAALLVWSAIRVKQLMGGQRLVLHTLFVVTHHVVFALAYVLIDSFDIGWLLVNIWHNYQYILFVWLQNNKRFAEGISSSAWFLSWLSQSKNWWIYFLCCLAITTVAYKFLEFALSGVGMVGFVLVAYMAINFHHYVVDAVIWKRRSRIFAWVSGAVSGALSPSR